MLEKIHSFTPTLYSTISTNKNVHLLTLGHNQCVVNESAFFSSITVHYGQRPTLIIDLYRYRIYIYIHRILFNSTKSIPVLKIHICL